MKWPWSLFAELEKPKPAGQRSPRAAEPWRKARQKKYDDLVITLKAKHHIRIHRWRKNTTGCAWQVRGEPGQCTNLIEAPYPRGPMSAAVFLHEVGHHAIGFHRYSPRCLEEYMAWKWALNAMDRYDIHITPSVRKRVDQSLRYAVAKARRRGLKRLPAELIDYV